ncbi:MAG: porin family protein [Vicinamibacterales bacterium]|nr:porin family protein [Vicinamibacterales bacterium]
MRNRLAVLMPVLVAALLVPVSTNAQGVSGGIKGGVLFSSIPQFGDTLEEAGVGIDVSQRVGFAGGAFLTLSLLPGFAIQPEVLYVQKGTELGVDGTDFSGSVNLDYIDVPVLARLSVGAGGARVYFVGGPSFNFNLKAETEFNTETDDVTDDVERYEISVVLGLGVEIGKLLVEGRWMEGLKNVSTDLDVENKSRTFAIMAGIRF